MSTTMATPLDGRDGPLDDRFIRLIAHLMEGGIEDDDTCRSLDSVTRLLSEEDTAHTEKPLHELIDFDGFETILGYLDMRQGPVIRSHATLTTSAYLKASAQTGTAYLHNFFTGRIQKGTYDDYIVAFSVAASIFPVVPAVTADLFLSPGFVGSLGNLMRRKWKSKKVEQACLEMLNAACMDSACREAIQKYCLDWLEEILVQHPKNAAEVDDLERQAVVEDGAIMPNVHSEYVRNLAAVVLAKLKVIPSNSAGNAEDRRVEQAATGMDELSDMFAQMLSTTKENDRQNSIEGLAYASLQPGIKEKLASNESFLTNLVAALKASPAKSPTTYGGLSILVNLTSYQPVLSEEQKKISQLKAYANASKATSKPNPSNDDEHVANRCKAVFKAGAIPVLVTHSQHGSPASLSLVVSIIFSLAKTVQLRGQIAQQGGVKLLVHAYSALPESDVQSRRRAAHALALILISTNPLHVFGGSNPLPLISAIRPLLTLLTDDPAVESSSLLPTFESLLALTNLASTDDSARNAIIRNSWSAIDDLMLSDNKLVSRATVELICNLVQSPEGVVKFADGSKQASQRMHILLALADSEEKQTRLAAGGALAGLTEWDFAVKVILEREGGVRNLLSLCQEEDEGLRHRGAVCILNIVSAPNDIGPRGVEEVKAEGGIDALKECLKKSRSQEVLEIMVEALKKIMSE